MGIFPVGSEAKDGKDVTILSQIDVERFNFDLCPGDLVLLTDFPVSKMQNFDLNLEDENKERYKIKVKFDGAEVTDWHPGDRVNVLGQFITDRDSRLRFAVNHCLESFGFKQNKYGYHLNDENFPNIIEVFYQQIDKNCDIAWGTIHGDLHWDNIMLENPANWWLIDYGLSGKGPILFDFIKLELYSRRQLIAKLKGITPDLLLKFELELIDNPFGELPFRNIELYQLQKAAMVIQTIRQFARPYIIGNFYDYLRMLFIYAVAFGKYYPAEKNWESAKNDSEKSEKLRELKFQFFTIFSAALSIARVLKWKELSSKKQRLKYEFLPMGSVADPDPGKIMLDVGSRCEPGIIDHHLNPESQSKKMVDVYEDSATALVFHKPELVSQHLTGTNVDEITWVVHEHPDFDCVSAVYLSWNIEKLGYLPPGAYQLAHYANTVDRGAEFLETVPLPEHTPYALFEFSLNSILRNQDPNKTYERRMERGIELINYFIDLEVKGIHSFYKNSLPNDYEFWQARVDIGTDQQKFRDRDERVSKKIKAKIIFDKEIREVPGIVLLSPQAYFFKAWARKAGYKLMVVYWPQPDKPDDRIVVSVPPYLKYALKGLGKELEKAETKKRKKMGKQRKRVNSNERRWEDVENGDPWYDGRSPIHAYTIVDSPRMGTVLTVEEVVHVLEKGHWPKR